MPQTYPDGTTAGGGKYVMRGGQWYPVNTGPVVVGSPDPTQPFKAPKADADIRNTQANTERTLAELDKLRDRRPAPPPGYRYTSDAKDAPLEPIPGGPKTGAADNPNTAAVRAQALQAYNAARLLSDQIVTMRDKFKAGPGSTSGLSGIADYFGGPANNAFDNAANAARGNVGTTLGFTGGQLNTATEAAMNVGPYLPSSWDYDANALDKMTQLEALRDKSIRQSIQVLGGIPDANGNITPVPQGVDPVEFAKKMWSSAPAGAPAPPGAPLILPPGGGGNSGGGPTPYAGPGPVADLNASGSTGSNVIGTGMNSVPNPQGEALYKEFLGLWAAGASDDTIRRWSQKIYGNVNPDVEAALTARKQGKKINFYPGQGLLTKDVDANLSRNPLDGLVADSASSPFGTFAVNFGNEATIGAPQWLAGKAGGNPDLTNIRFDTMNARNPNAAALGQLAGGAAGASLAELAAIRAAKAFGLGAKAVETWAPRVGDTVYGGVRGATGNPDNPGTGALLGGFSGLAGGMAGRAGVRAVGGAFRGIQNEAIRELGFRGIPLTTGQILGKSGIVGSAIKGIEDRLTSLPVVGDLIKSRRIEGLEGFNRSAFGDARQPIGAPPNYTIRAPGIDALDDDIGAAYRKALDGVNVTADAPFGADYGAAIRAGRALPEPMRGNAEFTLDTRVGNSFAPNGDLSGNNFQQSLRGLRGDISDNITSAYGKDFRNVAGQAEDALTGLVERQAPSVMPQYNAANQAYRLKEVLRSAVDRARNGSKSGELEVFTPSQLSDAAAANSRRFGNTQGTTKQPFYSLTRAGQDVLPSTVPDSGTAGRWATLALPTALGGAGYGLDQTGATDKATKAGIALGALLSLGGTRRAQRLFQTLLVDRPDAAIRIGDQIYSRQALGGIFGAPMMLDAQR